MKISNGTFLAQRKEDGEILVVKPIVPGLKPPFLSRGNLPSGLLEDFVAAQNCTDFIRAIDQLDPLCIYDLVEKENGCRRMQRANSFFSSFPDEYESVDVLRFGRLATPYLGVKKNDRESAEKICAAADLTSNKELVTWLSSTYGPGKGFIVAEPLADWALTRALAALTISLKSHSLTGPASVTMQVQLDRMEGKGELYGALQLRKRSVLSGSKLEIDYKVPATVTHGPSEAEKEQAHLAPTAVPKSRHSKLLPHRCSEGFISRMLETLESLAQTPDGRAVGWEVDYRGLAERHGEVEYVHNNTLTQIVLSAASCNCKDVCSRCGQPLFEPSRRYLDRRARILCGRCTESPRGPIIVRNDGREAV